MASGETGGSRGAGSSRSRDRPGDRSSNRPSDRACDRSRAGETADGQLDWLAGAAPPPSAAGADAAPRAPAACGPRACEAALLAAVTAAAAAREAALRAGDPTGVAAPLRIVVPSRSLREHVAAALVRHAGRSLLGVAVQTHVALALEVLERAERLPPEGDILVPVLVRRFAAREPELAHWLGALDDGFGVVEAAVRDLLDAGLEAATAEAVHEALAAAAAEGALAGPIGARAAATVRVAERVLAALDDAGLGHRTSLLVHAREALEAAAQPARLLPAAGLWVHGFADATGRVADWLEAVVRATGGHVLVERPPDPAVPGRAETGYAAAFAQRMGAAAAGRVLAAPPGSEPPPRIELLRAPGTAAEVRAVAARIRVLLDAGARPEAIGVVARRPRAYAAALGAQFGRLGIPFSAHGAAAGADAVTRRAGALARLLEGGEHAPIETWLAADGRSVAADADLRVALHVLGAGRLGQVPSLDLDARLRDEPFLRLPVRRGGAAPATAEPDAGADDEPGDETADAAAASASAPPGAVPRNPRRTISRTRLEAARARAEQALASLRAWPTHAPFAAHVAALRALVDGALAWRPASVGCGPALEALAALADALPGELELSREEMALLVARALADVAPAAFGGAGAGVQVLSVTAARGRTFEHLFVLGLNRDVFPRAILDDPVLPDAVRRRLRRDVLPEMPVKARMRDEERHLFASLCAAAPHVTLSWQHVGDEGRTRPASPFAVRLQVARPELPVHTAPPLFDPAPDGPQTDPVPAAAPRPAHEHAVLAGLREAARPALVALRALALDEARSLVRGAALAPAGGGDADPAALARLHVAVLREIDGRPPRADEEAPRLGPWFGWVGAAPPTAASDDPELHVTRLEALARCGWQAFLRRELGLEPVPDALAALPAPTPLLRGQVVHRVLERIVGDALPAPRPATLAAALERGPVRVPWPDPERLDALVRAAAHEVALEEGLVLGGFVAALARSVRPLLDAARAVDWSEPGGPATLGAELAGSLVVSDAAGRPRRIGFRADRADLRPDGTLRITDYKAGRPISRSGTPATAAAKRREHFLEDVRRGRSLQGPAYWRAARALGAARAEGRFLFLAADVPEPAREFRVGDADEALAEAFEATTRVVLAAADHGALFPRLADPVQWEEPSACSWCEVSEACLRGESIQRARLRRWAEAAAAGARLAPAERAALALLELGVAPEPPRADSEDAARAPRAPAGSPSAEDAAVREPAP